MANQLSRICGLSGIGFLILIIVLRFADEKGIASQLIFPAAVLLPLALYMTVGLLTRSAGLSQFQVANEQAPAPFAGMAAAAEWTAAALLFAPSAALFLSGYDGRPLLIGLTGGYLLLTVFIAPFVGNSPARSLPDFMYLRFGGVTRFLVTVVVLACTGMFLIAVVQTAAATFAGVTGTVMAVAAGIVVGILLLCLLPGGAMGLTATQVAQYMVLLIAAIGLFLGFEAKHFDAPTGRPYDPVFQAMDALLRGAGLAPVPSPRSVRLSAPQAINNLAFIICLMVGTASLPHVIMRARTTANMGKARTAMAWSLVFIALLVFTLPTYMLLAKSGIAQPEAGTDMGLIATIGLAAMLAAGNSALLSLASSLEHNVLHPLFGERGRIRAVRAILVIVAVLVAYAVGGELIEPASMLAWSFSLAAGLFPPLVLGIWWARTSSSAAVLGIIAGIGMTLFYLLVTRYFPQAGINQFAMSALLDPASGSPVVDVNRVLADPRWAGDWPASPLNPLASHIGWFNISNLACGIFGLAAGFLVTFAVSLASRRPSEHKLKVLYALRAPGAARKL